MAAKLPWHSGHHLRKDRKFNFNSKESLICMWRSVCISNILISCSFFYCVIFINRLIWTSKVQYFSIASCYVRFFSFHSAFHHRLLFIVAKIKIFYYNFKISRRLKTAYKRIITMFKVKRNTSFFSFDA